MSRVFFASDHHIGHKHILSFSPTRGGTSVDEHDEWVIEQHNRVVNKRDVVWFLGDLCFDINKLSLISKMKGRKKLVLGNHDNFHMHEYLKYFDDVRGPFRYKGYWVTHMPMHPVELYGASNIHGHVHMNHIKDSKYINVSLEPLHGVPVLFQDIKNGSYKTHKHEELL